MQSPSSSPNSASFNLVQEKAIHKVHKSKFTRLLENYYKDHYKNQNEENEGRAYCEERVMLNNK